jgi:hypothetical protein
MQIGAIVKRLQKASADNAPTILTAIGATGLITTAVLTGQASFKAAEVLARTNPEYRDGTDSVHKLDSREKAELIWKFYIPAVGTGAVTLVCIIAANRIHTRRAAALASAYTISQELFREYKEKVLEKLGEKKEQEVRDEIAKDRLKKPPAEIFMIGTGEVLCYDMHSGRYFINSLEGLKKGENDTNYQIIHSDYASLTDYWDRIGLPKTSESDELGWSTDARLEVNYSSLISEDGKPCITIRFTTIPIRGYYAVYH